jgi:hypothetical protein
MKFSVSKSAPDHKPSTVTDTSYIPQTLKNIHPTQARSGRAIRRPLRFLPLRDIPFGNCDKFLRVHSMSKGRLTR